MPKILYNEPAGTPARFLNCLEWSQPAAIRYPWSAWAYGEPPQCAIEMFHNPDQYGSCDIKPRDTVCPDPLRRFPGRPWVHLECAQMLYDYLFDNPAWDDIEASHRLYYAWGTHAA